MMAGGGNSASGMTDELCRDSALAIKRFFERKDHKHAADIFAHELDAVLLPRPELRADKINDRHAES